MDAAGYSGLQVIPNTADPRMNLLSTLKFIAAHPFNRGHEAAALRGFVRWQLASRMLAGEMVIDWVDGAKVMVRRGETGMTGNLYCGLHEFADMAYVLHVVEPDELFVDVGANVGSYTVLACAARGARGICVEPLPSTFARLLNNLRVNDLSSRVEALNIGLADREGELRFSTSENAMNHVLAQGEEAGDALRVPVRRLDDVLGGRAPAMMKIDVEGFETAVLAGAADCLGQPAMHSVIMELNGSGARYGYDEARILGLMRDFGFASYTYEPYTRKLQSLEGKNHASGNTIFIRDIGRVTEKISRAGPARILGRTL
jgi:FkbM family methyltransferase